MVQKYVITITLQEDLDDMGSPELKINYNAKGVETGQFALMAKTFKALTEASLESHLQVSSDLSITAQKASDAGAFDEDED